jgi:hypothetical protein
MFSSCPSSYRTVKPPIRLRLRLLDEGTTEPVCLVTTQVWIVVSRRGASVILLSR